MRSMTVWEKKQLTELRSSLKVLKMRIVRAADLSGKNIILISPDDYKAFVEAREINALGRLRTDRSIVVKADSSVEAGSVRVSNVSLN